MIQTLLHSKKNTRAIQFYQREQFVIQSENTDNNITVIPMLLGSGIRLFENGKHEIKLRLLNTQSYNGMIDLIYIRR